MAHVKAHLEQFGLNSKDPELLRNCVHVLGLHVWEEHGRLQWRRGGKLLTAPNVLNHWGIFTLCGKLTGHLPVCLASYCDFICEASNAGRNHYKSISDEPILWWLVCGWARCYCMGGCKLYCHQCYHWEWWIHNWGCKLVATDALGQAHKSGAAQYWCQPGAAIEGKCNLPADRLSMHAPPDF